jgi:hypothetical protein
MFFFGEWGNAVTAVWWGNRALLPYRVFYHFQMKFIILIGVACQNGFVQLYAKAWRSGGDDIAVLPLQW